MRRSAGFAIGIAFLIIPLSANADTLGSIQSNLQSLILRLQGTGSLTAAAASALPVPGVPVVQRDIGGQAVCNDDISKKTCFVIANWPDPVAPVLKDSATAATVSWSQIPALWQTIAKNYDSVTFSTAKDAQGHAPFSWALSSTAFTYPNDMSGFGVYSYYGDDRSSDGDYALEGVTTLSAMVGGSLAGIDYSKKIVTGVTGETNLVSLSKKYFGNTSGVNAFLDHMNPDTASTLYIGSGQFWYDLTPGILACQLGDLYKSPTTGSDAYDPDSPSLMSLCLKTVDTWNKVADALTSTQSQIPEFGYTAAQLVAGNLPGTTTRIALKLNEPIQTCPSVPVGFYWNPAADPSAHFSFNPSIPFHCVYQNGSTQYQSDAAAGIGYLDMLAYEKTGNQAYLAHAASALGFLDAIQYNPDYENLLPYGTVAAARLNAEYGKVFSVGKYLNWIFSDSDTRYFWGIASGSWGGFPVYGLKAEPKYSAAFASDSGLLRAYASAQDTFSVAQSLAPVARYQPQYAQALGKYFAHIATNALMFYPQYAPHQESTTTSYIAASGGGFSKILKNSIPYEGLLAGAGSVQCGAAEPCGSGDSHTYGLQHHTNLAIYGGSAGALAALIHGTTVPGIYQIDLVATDMPKPNAYPTYLVYNPLPQSQSVGLDIALARRSDARLGTAPVLLYDIVSKTILSQNSSGDIATTTLAHDQAAVIAVIPQSVTLSVSAGKLSANSNVIVDYYYNQAPPSPAQPALCSLGGITLASGQAATFYSAATVPRGSSCSAITQVRLCQNGTLSGSSSFNQGSCAVAISLPAVSIASDSRSLAMGSSTKIHLFGTYDASDAAPVLTMAYTVNGGQSGVYPAGMVSGTSADWTFNATSSGVFAFYGYIKTSRYPDWTQSSTTAVVTVAPQLSVAISAPANGVTVAKTQVVSASVLGTSACSGVQFQLDGVPIGPKVTSAPYALQWNTASTTNGMHTLSAIAYGPGSITASTSTSVSVLNIAPPTVTVAADATAIVVGQSTGIHVRASFDPNEAAKYTNMAYTINGGSTGVYPNGRVAGSSQDWTFNATTTGTYVFYGYASSQSTQGWIQSPTPVTVSVAMPTKPSVATMADKMTIAVGQSTGIHVRGTIDSQDAGAMTTMAYTINGGSRGVYPAGNATNVNLDYTFNATSTGTFTFYGYIQSRAYPNNWIQSFSPVTVTVVPAAPLAPPTVAISTDKTALTVGQSTGIHVRGAMDPNDSNPMTTMAYTIGGGSRGVYPAGTATNSNLDFTFNATSTGSFAFYGYIMTSNFNKTWTQSPSPVTVVVSNVAAALPSSQTAAVATADSIGTIEATLLQVLKVLSAIKQ